MDWGGVASCTATLVNGLKEYRNIESVVGSTNGEGVRSSMFKGINTHVIEFDSKNPLAIVKNYLGLRALVKKYNIDIIHAQNRIPALYASFYCMFHKNVKYIWANHLVPIPSSPLYRLLTKYGACAVAESIDGKKLLINDLHIPSESVKVVNLGCDLTSFTKTTIDEQRELRRSYNILDDEKVIMLYGRLHPVKGHLFLLNALAKSDFCSAKYKLVFPGIGSDSYKQEIIKKASDYGIEDKIIFPGFVNGRDFLSISSLMVLPSKQEGFGIVNVESFCMGVPVIRTMTGGYSDMKDFCFGVDYGDVEGLSKLLNKFFEDSVIFKEKADYAQKNVSTFGVEKMVQNYFEIYSSALKR